MKREVPSMPWAEELPLRVPEIRSNKNDYSALPGNEKRIFRFMYGDDRPGDAAIMADPEAVSAHQPMISKRLFCSRFITIRKD